MERVVLDIRCGRYYYKHRMNVAQRAEYTKEHSDYFTYGAYL